MFRPSLHIVVSSICFTLLMISTAQAVPKVVDLSQSQECFRYFSRYEKKYHIPGQLLKALSIKETGVMHRGLGRRVPWPWAVNVRGQGYYYNSKSEAVKAVRKLVARGVKSIDVGCMQINLLHHPKAFRNIEQAFTPKYNVAYAAQLLNGHYRRKSSWRKAVASYHNSNYSVSKYYAKSVMNIWNSERGKKGSFTRANYVPTPVRKDSVDVVAFVKDRPVLKSSVKNVMLD